MRGHRGCVRGSDGIRCGVGRTDSVGRANSWSTIVDAAKVAVYIPRRESRGTEHRAPGPPAADRRPTAGRIHKNEHERTLWSDGVRCADPAESPRARDRGVFRRGRRARCRRRAPLRSRDLRVDRRDLRAARARRSRDSCPAVLLVVAVPLVYVRLSLALHELLHLRAGGARARVPSAGDDLRHAVRTRLSRASRAASAPSSLRRRRRRSGAASRSQAATSARSPTRWSHRNARCVAWIRTHGISAPLAREAGLRLAAFVLVATLNPMVFLLYWIVLRASIGAAGFVFHHVLHNRERSSRHVRAAGAGARPADRSRALRHASRC